MALADSFFTQGQQKIQDIAGQFQTFNPAQIQSMTASGGPLSIGINSLSPAATLGLTPEQFMLLSKQQQDPMTKIGNAYKLTDAISGKGEMRKSLMDLVQPSMQAQFNEAMQNDRQAFEVGQSKEDRAFRSSERVAAAKDSADIHEADREAAFDRLEKQITSQERIASNSNASAERRAKMAQSVTEGRLGFGEASKALQAHQQMIKSHETNLAKKGADKDTLTFELAIAKNQLNPVNLWTPVKIPTKLIGTSPTLKRYPQIAKALEDKDIDALVMSPTGDVYGMKGQTKTKLPLIPNKLNKAKEIYSAGAGSLLKYNPYSPDLDGGE